MTTRAAQIELLADTLIDPTTGSPCGGYSAEFYAAGTSTAKNVWTEKEKTNPFTTYTLDSGGKALLYGDGVYKVVIKNTSGSAVLTLDNQIVMSSFFSVVKKTGAYTATPDDDVILCDGTFTLSLQTVANFVHPVSIKNIGAGTITVDPYSAETIDGDATYSLSVVDSLIQLYPDTDSTAWRIGYKVLTNGVTNGDSHDHAGGDGGQLLSSSINFTQAGTGAVTRTSQNKERERVSVFDYMTTTEIADVQAGSLAVDVTAAIQAAIDADIGAVYLPQGSYLHTRVTLLAGSMLYGDGWGKTILYLKDSTDDYGLYWTGKSKVIIRDLKLDGNSANNTGASAIRIEGASYDPKIENCWVYDYDTDGIAVTGTGEYASVTGCKVESCGHDGIVVSGPKQAVINNNVCLSNGRFGIIGAGNSIRIENNKCDSNYDSNIAAVSVINVSLVGNQCAASTTGHGLHFNSITRGIMVGNIAKDNALSGLDCYASTRCTVTGNISHNNTVRGIEIDSAAYYCTVGNNVVYGNGEVGISIFRSPSTSVIGNHVMDNGNVSATEKYGIRLWDTAGTLPSSNCRISGNYIADDRGGSATQTHGLYLEDANITGTIIEGNTFIGNITLQVYVNAVANIYRARDNFGWITERFVKSTAVTDGATVAHGMTVTPTIAQATGSVAGEIISVTSIDATNLTIAIKTHAGAAGTSQTIFWQASAY